jgi:hypothetical protein
MRYSYNAFFPIISLLPFFSVAQSNYKPGYAVKLKGDTIRGYIDYKEWDKNPKKILFKSATDNTKAEILSPANTSALNIAGFESFRRFVLPVSQDQVDVNKLSTLPDTTSVTDTVFLKVTSSGKHIGLFSYTDNIKTRFYISEGADARVQELTYHVYYDASSSSSIQYTNRYRSQLEYFAQKYHANSSRLDQQISRAAYTETDLAGIIQIINGDSTPALAHGLAGSRWFVGAGVNVSNAKFSQVAISSGYNGTVNNQSSVFPKIAAGIDFFQNKDIRRLIIRCELSFTINQYNFSTASSGNVQSIGTLNFKQFNSAFIPQVIYNLYNGAASKFFLSAGAAFTLSSYNNYAYITKYSGSFPDNVQYHYPALSSFWISFPIKAGLALSNLEFNICYIPSSSITEANANSVNITSFQAGINYWFGGK